MLPFALYLRLFVEQSTTTFFAFIAVFAWKKFHSPPQIPTQMFLNLLNLLRLITPPYPGPEVRNTFQPFPHDVFRDLIFCSQLFEREGRVLGLGCWLCFHKKLTAKTQRSSLRPKKIYKVS
jgi:hypothetical protein